MATRPARAPFKLMPTSGFPILIQLVIMAKIARVAAARLVFTKIMAMSSLLVMGVGSSSPAQARVRPKAANRKKKNSRFGEHGIRSSI